MSNYRKLVTYLITTSRLYRPVVSVYFLTLPDTTPAQISIYVMAYFITSLVLEIPSWYIWDTFGHKKTMILAQILFFLATALFAGAQNLWYFIIANIILAAALSLISGTVEAYYYEILEDQGKEEHFGEEWGKLKWNVAFIAMFLMFLFPVIWEINIHRPFYIYTAISWIWILIATTLDKPKAKHHIDESLWIRTIIKQQRSTWYYVIALFFGIIAGIYSSEVGFRWPYIVDLWLSLSYIWIMLWWSRFLIWSASKSGIILPYLEQLSLKHFMLFDMLIIWCGYMIISQNGLWWLTVITFSCVIGYRQTRRGVISKHLIKTLSNKKYKATLLSIFGQLTSICSIVFSGLFWYTMMYWYSFWYMIVSLCILVILWVYFVYIVLPTSKKDILRKLFL